MDMTAAAVENATAWSIDCLVCLGGGGTQKNALQRCEEAGLNVLTLPKTIDNDVAETDISFGFDTAHEHRHRSHRPAAHAPPPATTASSSAKSWGTRRAGWRWGPASPAART